MKYRITRYNKLNWRLEEWVEGGEPHRLAKGGLSKPHWKPIESYHSNLEQAAKALLDHAAGDALLAKEVLTIKGALELATERVIAAVREAQAVQLA